MDSNSMDMKIYKTLNYTKILSYVYYAIYIHNQSNII